MRVSVIIPARNEGDVVLDVALATRAVTPDVIVVDGHSTDGSPERLRAAGITVISDQGRGKGDALRCGFAVATGDILVTMDADGSHDPTEIPALVEPITAGRADLVIGCRMRGGSDEFAGTWTMFIRLWGNNFLTQVINTRHGVRLTDSQNGFRAIRASALRALPLREDLHTIELEMVLQALRRGLRVEQVPAHEFARRAGHSSLSVIEQTPAFLWCLVKNIV
jgi:glycosyltransferase involved in cell wall biosynthesis